MSSRLHRSPAPSRRVPSRGSSSAPSPPSARPTGQRVDLALAPRRAARRARPLRGRSDARAGRRWHRRLAATSTLRAWLPQGAPALVVPRCWSRPRRPCSGWVGVPRRAALPHGLPPRRPRDLRAVRGPAGSRSRHRRRHRGPHARAVRAKLPERDGSFAGCGARRSPGRARPRGDRRARGLLGRRAGRGGPSRRSSWGLRGAEEARARPRARAMLALIAASAVLARRCGACGGVALPLTLLLSARALGSRTLARFGEHPWRRTSTRARASRARCCARCASAPTATATASPGAFGGGDCDDHNPPSTPARPTSPATASTRTARGRRAATAPPRRPRPARPAPDAPAQRDRARGPEPRGHHRRHAAVGPRTTRATPPHHAQPRRARGAESVVFDHAYAISSYTGRAIGPMMTGRYPTECPRDAQHFTRYLPGNVFLAERC
jgi:hypothetical protein